MRCFKGLPVAMFVVFCLGLTLPGCADDVEKKAENNPTSNSTTVNNTTPNNSTTPSSTTLNNVTENNTTSVTPGEIDLLWVIDNSGSMCQEQQTLRNNLQGFLESLYTNQTNFQIGITTTHMIDDYPLEPVARPGHLQSTPQPVPGFDQTCLNGIDADGNPVAGDFTPIRAAIAFAAECAGEDPNNYNFTDNELECVVQGRNNCSACDGGSCELADIMPRSFPDFPKVYRSTEYASAEEMAADLACASFVGTRGYGIEKGLEAAVAALDPQLTGGTLVSPTDPDAPNHGLLRDSAAFGLFFFTDENDCTHDGSLDERSACGSTVCDYANAIDATDSPLVDVDSLRAELFANLSASKGRTVGANEVLVASFHGTPNRLESAPAAPQETCAAPDWEGVPPVCVTPTFGIAASGDRYSRFASQFSTQFPQTRDGIMAGEMCTGDLSAAFQGLADYFSPAAR